jgi:hypothetical protein
MPGSLPVRCALALGVTLVIAVGCGGTVTNVGSIGSDGGVPDAPAPTGQDGAPPEADASHDGPGDSAVDAHAPACAAGPCGASICGRDECGHTCGLCAGAPDHGGCFTGHCITSCPGTPCLDHNGEHICEGGRGGKSCTGGVLGIQVCTCTGGGPDAWTSCGTCL